MGLLRKSIIVIIIGVVIKLVLRSVQFVPPTHFEGTVEKGFEAVEQAFRQNFEGGYDTDGAAFAVCHKGKLVVDLWGGYSDKEALRKWKQDTMTTAFSTTKAVSALVIAMLVDRGQLNYDDLVTKYWPEFGADKKNVTVKMLVSHQAGLAGLDEPITLEMIRDHRKMSKAFEQQVPNWPPGTQTGYHALTFGWLCDQLVRRVDPQHRSLGTFFRDEVAKKFGIDFFIGLPRDQLSRVARMSLPGLWDILIRMDDWEYVKVFAVMTWDMTLSPTPLMQKVFHNPTWLDTSQGYFEFNNPDVMEVEVPGANGIGTARALAKLMCLLDGTELLSKKTLDKISKPLFENYKDKVMSLNLTYGWGFMHTKSPEGHYQLGHAGYGGQNAKFDSKERLGFAYLRNNMAVDMADLTRTFRNLQHAVYQSIKGLKS